MRFVAGRECHRENLLARGAMAKLLVRTAGESSWLGRPDRVATGRGAAVKSLREDVAGRSAVAELLVRAAGESSWLGALRQRAIGKLLLAGEPRQSCWPASLDAVAECHREAVAGRGAVSAEMLLARAP